MGHPADLGQRVRPKRAWRSPSFSGRRQPSCDGYRQAGRDRFKKILDIRQSLAKAYPDVPIFQQSLSKAYMMLADLDSDEHNRHAARDGFQKMFEICQRLAEVHSDVPDFQQNLSAAYERLGELDVAEGNRQTAHNAFKASFAINQDLADAHPEVPVYQLNLSAAYMRLASLDLSENNHQAARDRTNAAHAIRQQLAETHPDVPEYKRSLAISRCRLAAVDVSEGDIASAIGHFAKSLQTMHELTSTSSAVPLDDVGVAECCLWLTLLESARELPAAAPPLTVLRNLMLLELGGTIDSVSKRIDAVRTFLTNIAIAPKRRAELAAIRAMLEAHAAASRLDPSAKDWLTLIEAALASPPPKPRGLLRRMLGA